MADPERTLFEKKEKPGDSFVAVLRTMYRIPEQASLEDIEPIANVLLVTPTTFLRAAELVFNRELSMDDFREFGAVLARTPSDERFATLLLYREEMERRNKST